MKNGQGKNLGWMKVKGEILRAVISGDNTREKLKAIFTPHIVSTKDIDYHLRGTPAKPGLIRKGILREKKGILTLNLQSTEKLREILEDYLLPFPEYRRALDLEFSACFLSEYGDLLSSVHSLSRQQSNSLRDYHDWAMGYRPDNVRDIEDSIMRLAAELSARTRGHLNDRDKISYVLAYHSLIVLAPSMDDDLNNEVEWKWREIYDRSSTTEITLAWKDMNLIREEVKDYSKTPFWIIKLVFDRLQGLATHDQKQNVFPGEKLEDPGITEAAGIMEMVMNEGIDELSFNAALLSWIDTIGISTFRREIIKIMRSEGFISVSELDRLGKILKAFNDSQPARVRKFMKETERTIERFHGKLDP